MPSCLRFFPALKCFSPAAGHTVVETLCLRKDSGTDVTAGYVPLCAHWLSNLSSVVLLSCVHILSGGFCSRFILCAFVLRLALVWSRCVSVKSMSHRAATLLQPRFRVRFSSAFFSASLCCSRLTIGPCWHWCNCPPHCVLNLGY